MQVGTTIPVPNGVANIVTRAELPASHAWKKALQYKYKGHRYYELVEQTLDNDFDFHYAVLKDSAGIVRAIQPIFFVRQNLVEGVPAKLRAIVDLIRKKFPRFLTMRVLMVGCAAG